MHHGRWPPSGKMSHESEGRGHSVDRLDPRGDPRHTSSQYHNDYNRPRGDSDHRHRDFESPRRGHDNRSHENRGHHSRGHDGRPHEGRSHGGQEYHREDSNRHHNTHHNSIGSNRRSSHDQRYNGRPPPPHHHNNGPPPPPPSGNDGRHRNGPEKRPPPPHSGLPREYTAFKLIIDPSLHQDQLEKVVRYDGIIPGDKQQVVPTPHDPRRKVTKFWKEDDLDLPIPRFTIDEHYVGPVPKVEVTFENLNDNIDKQFLGKTLTKYAEWETVHILYHPVTHKHLGLAKAVFKTSKGARQCVSSVHQKTIMGQSVNCYLDPGGKACNKIFEELTCVRKPSPPPLPPQHEEEEDDVEGEGGRMWEGHHQQGWGEPAPWGESRSSHGWPGDRGGHDDWQQRGGGAGGHEDWETAGRTRNPPRWDEEEAQDGWADQQFSRHAPRHWGAENRPSRDRDRRGKAEWRRSQEETEDTAASRWSEEHSRFQENSNHGAYHPETEQHHSSTLLPPPVPAASEAEPAPAPPEPEQQESEHDEAASMDLDTRLAMLMQKGKSNMPAFLVPSESSDNDDGGGKGEGAPAETEAPPPPPPPEHNGPLSRTPSPFASRDQYLASHKLTVQHEELERVNAALANMPPLTQPSTDSVDQSMFPANFQPPGFPGGHFGGAPPGHFPGQFGGGFTGYWGGDSHLPAPAGHMPAATWGPEYQDPYWSEHGYYDYGQQDYYQEAQHIQEDLSGAVRKSGKDLMKTLLENVIKIVQKELKAILKKDINKKLCESYAYLLFDKWWSEQEAIHKAKQEEEFRKKAETSSNTTIPRLPDREKVEALPRIPKPEDVTNLIEKQRESGTSTFGFGGSLGLGFRGSIPKMAKRIEKKIPKENKAPDRETESSTLDKEDKKKKKKHKDKEEEQELINSVNNKKNKNKPVYSTIYSDSDEEDTKKKKKKEESESSEVEESEEEEESSEESDSDSSSDSSTDQEDASSSDSSDSDSEAEGSAKSRASSVTSKKSRSSSASPKRKSRSRSLSVSKSRSKSKSRSISVSRSKSRSLSRSKSRSRSRSKSLSRSKSRSRTRSGSRSRSKSTSPLSARLADEPVAGSSRSPVRQSSVTSTPESAAAAARKPQAAPPGTPLDRRRKSQLESAGSVSSSPALSRPPTPDIQPKSSTKSKKVVTPALVSVDNSDTETGSEIEIVDEVSSPRKPYKPYKDEPPSTPGKDAKSAAEALVALSGAGSGIGTPVKVQNVANSPPHIMDHCYARPAPSKPRQTAVTTETSADETSKAPTASAGGGGFDHDYTKPRTPPRASEPVAQKAMVVKERVAAAKKSSLPSQPVKFKPRNMSEKFQILYKFLTDGIDSEDVMYIKRSYEMMLNEGLNQPNLAWMNDTHWVDHPVTLVPDPPRKKRRLDDFSKPHKSGCARTEGYYKLDPREKARTKYHFHRPGVDAFNTGKLGHGNQQKPQKAINVSREARSQQRRMLTALGDEFIESDLLKFNQLKFRRKAMKFGKSAIHDWGLFAMEHIGADEMVIEYVGDVVRPILSDIREKRYEKQGIGSSYLFRIDLDYVVDATKCGNLARFINHSCEPNCYAKVIKIDGESKIVIYSKQPIAIGEEITYDYKFPIEDEKIRCLCGEKNCRKYLN